MRTWNGLPTPSGTTNHFGLQMLGKISFFSFSCYMLSLHRVLVRKKFIFGPPTMAAVCFYPSKSKTRHAQSLNSLNQLKLALAPARRRFPPSQLTTTAVSGHSPCLAAQVLPHSPLTLVPSPTPNPNSRRWRWRRRRVLVWVRRRCSNVEGARGADRHQMRARWSLCCAKGQIVVL